MSIDERRSFMLPDSLPVTTENPIASWVVSSEIYPKGQLHPSNSMVIRDHLTWGVFLQVVAMQLREYEREHDTKEREQWITRITQTILAANQLNPSGLYGYQDAPLHPMPEYLVLSATDTWLERLTRKLMETFGNAIPVIILRTD